MKWLFLSIGKKHDPLFKEAIEEYSIRINRHINLEWRFIPSSNPDNEASEVLSLFEDKNGAELIVLDERGKEFSTLELAKFVEQKMIAGHKTLIFAIGGSFGWTDAVRQKAGTIWSLSRLTLPHQLVRLCLAESLARALSVIKGEPYHHAS